MKKVVIPKYEDCMDILERYKDKTFDGLIAAFGAPVEERAATESSGRIVAFRNVEKKIPWLIVSELPNGKYQFHCKAGEMEVDDDA